jgi:hypothetical protein
MQSDRFGSGYWKHLNISSQYYHLAASQKSFLPCMKLSSMSYYLTVIITRGYSQMHQKLGKRLVLLPSQHPTRAISDYQTTRQSSRQRPVPFCWPWRWLSVAPTFTFCFYLTHSLACKVWGVETCLTLWLPSIHVAYINFYLPAHSCGSTACGSLPIIGLRLTKNVMDVL